MARILITRDAGYVGSHCAKALATVGHDRIVFDDLTFGNREFVRWGATKSSFVMTRVRKSIPEIASTNRLMRIRVIGLRREACFLPSNYPRRG
jgi:UDP-glucose 4-epimerase